MYFADLMVEVHVHGARKDLNGRCCDNADCQFTFAPTRGMHSTRWLIMNRSIPFTP